MQVRRRFLSLARLRVLGSGLLLSALVAHGCGEDPDTPTPTPKTYPSDDIDKVPVTTTAQLQGLQEPVRVVRDKRGMVHVYARNVHDAAMAQGYFMAQDRAPQLELLRRAAEGRLAEALGNGSPQLAGQDLALRTMGLRRAAEKYWASMKDPNARAILEGFSAGVTSYFRKLRCLDAKHDETEPTLACPAAKEQVPNGWRPIGWRFYTDWDPIGTLSIARLQTFLLSDTSGDEIDFTELYTKATDTFRLDATDPALKARAGFLVDAARFEPAAKRPVLDFGVPTGTSTMDLKKPGKPSFASPPRISSELFTRTKAFSGTLQTLRDFFGGEHWSSNNWAIGKDKSATGNALVASDPHLQLSAPSIFYMSSLHVISDDPAQQLDVAGMAFAGIPGVVLGFNKNVAWGATVAVFDVNDVYKDTIVDGKVTMKKPDGTTEQVAVEKIEETIDYGDGNKVPITFESIPGHGIVMPTIVDQRFVPRTSSDVLTVRWTGMEPSAEFEAFMNLNRAKNVDEAYDALTKFEVGAQNFVIGDSSGNIRYTTHSRVPTRPKGAFAWDPKTAKGQLPCMILPGDQGLEWNGQVPEAQLPGVKNPAWGYVATANSDQYGLVFDNDPTNDPIYLSCTWDVGLRENRVRERIDALPKLSLDDLASIQADAKSPLGARMSKYFIKVLERAEASRLGTTPAADLDALVKDPRYDGTRMAFVLSVLKQWEGFGYDTPAAYAVEKDAPPTNDEVLASQATLLFNFTLVPLLHRTFDDEIKAMGNPPYMRDLQIKALLRILDKPEPLATAGSDGESVLWDDLSTKDVSETRDQQILAAMLDGIDALVKKLGPNPDKWRWGAAHGVRFASLFSKGDLAMSIPDGTRMMPDVGFPRHGDWAVIDRSDPGLGGFDFGYGSGPAQRFVANMDAKGPQVKNALPGGNVWKPGDAHFDDEAELWRHNQNKPVAFSPGEVVPEAESRTDLVP